MASGETRRTGRRPGSSGTREAIAAAAREQFATVGFDRATIRSIALRAGVDPALVMHFYGNKRQLFVSVLDLPVNLGRQLPAVLEGDRASVGARLADFVAGVLGDPATVERVEAMVRAAASEPRAAEVLRELITTHMMTPIAENLDMDDAALRANLVGSTVAGMVMARRIIGVEPLASLETEDLAAVLAPVLQHYLVGPLVGPLVEK